MNLYLLTRPEGADYDEFDAIIVSAPDEATARRIHPLNKPFGDHFSCWTPTPETLEVTLLGTALTNESKLILGSFNAG